MFFFFCRLLLVLISHEPYETYIIFVVAILLLVKSKYKRTDDPDMFLKHDYLPFPKRQLLDSSKMEEAADDNFKFDENSRQFSKREENTTGKGEIARYEQFLLFPLCFRKTCTADTKKSGLVWERVNIE